jgi:hypothetical protein
MAKSRPTEPAEARPDQPLTPEELGSEGISELPNRDALSVLSLGNVFGGGAHFPDEPSDSIEVPPPVDGPSIE